MLLPDRVLQQVLMYVIETVLTITLNVHNQNIVKSQTLTVIEIYRNGYTHIPYLCQITRTCIVKI